MKEKAEWKALVAALRNARDAEKRLSQALEAEKQTREIAQAAASARADAEDATAKTQAEVLTAQDVWFKSCR